MGSRSQFECAARAFQTPTTRIYWNNARIKSRSSRTLLFWKGHAVIAYLFWAVFIFSEQLAEWLRITLVTPRSAFISFALQTDQYTRCFVLSKQHQTLFNIDNEFHFCRHDNPRNSIVSLSRHCSLGSGFVCSCSAVLFWCSFKFPWCK